MEDEKKTEEKTLPDGVAVVAREEKPAEPLKEEDLEICARAVHDGVRGYGVGIGHNGTTMWEGSPDWEKDHARSAMRAADEGRADGRALYEAIQPTGDFGALSPQRQRQFALTAAFANAAVDVFRGL